MNQLVTYLIILLDARDDANKAINEIMTDKDGQRATEENK